MAQRPGQIQVPIRRVRKAFEQVAEQLQELIADGTLRPGQRIPTEAVLAAEFGVSRATIREALRVLAAQSLVRTAKGAGGGSYVNFPTVDGVSDLLSSPLGLMSASAELTLDDFLQAREMLEVPAAGCAAVRRSDEDLEALIGSVPDDPLGLGAEEQFVHNRHFHFRLVQAAGNPLLSIVAQPIFVVLQTHLQRSNLRPRSQKKINDEHREIVQALEARDADAAEAAMRRHLQSLRSTYERCWKQSS
jgi:DNA-binding FadR family transcriptional regulator